MTVKFDTGQLRGAYKAGLDAGLKHGIERMHLEGWRRNSECEIPVEGEIVKTLVPLFSGWIGLGRVIHADSGGVQVLKLDQSTGDPDGDCSYSADLCLNQIARKKVVDA